MTARKPPVTLDPWGALRAHTPARIALGRAGASLPTGEVLRFGQAHALARDAVHLALDAAALEEAMRGEGFATCRVESAAPDRATYLLRPDLGRRLDERSTARLQAQHSGDAPPCDLLLVAADGLSSLAVQRHALPLAKEIRQRAPAGWRIGPVVIATQARVALGDDIGGLLRARLVAMLIGERPGLSSPDSLGIYLTWAPQRGRSEAQRNCISNVRPEGLAYDKAAAKLWWLCTEARRLQATGVALKDMSDAPALAPGNAP
jgi:ethanolamine ammonia-lyase small subunit